MKIGDRVWWYPGRKGLPVVVRATVTRIGKRITISFDIIDDKIVKRHVREQNLSLRLRPIR